MNIDVNELSQIIRLVDGNHSLGAGALAEAILDHLPAPQIIRTPAELGACDRDDVFAVRWGVTTWVGLATAVNDGWPAQPLPAVKVASGEHVRACREALGEATP